MFYIQTNFALDKLNVLNLLINIAGINNKYIFSKIKILCLKIEKNCQEFLLQKKWIILRKCRNDDKFQFL